MENVIFSVVVGLLLLVLGAYGRIGGHLPPDSPYAPPAHRSWTAADVHDFPSAPAEFTAEAAMREAEIAVAEHRATEDQRRRVEAMSHVVSRRNRRRMWMSFDED